MTTLDPFQLGLLVSGTVALILLVAFIGSVLAFAWGWARAFGSGEFRWSSRGVEAKAERSARIQPQGDQQ